jgi:hypothetical protein
MPFLVPFIPAIAGVAGAVIAGNASKSAANTQAAAVGDANALQREQYDQTRKDQEPWRLAGQESLNKLMGLLNDGSLTSKFAGQNVQNEPGYAFGMKQGMDTAKMLGSRSGGFGGDVLKAGTKFAEDYAGTKYNDAFNRFQTERQNMLDPLYRISGFGSSANTSNQVAGQNFANQAGGNMLGAANAQAASGIERGNIYGNALNQLAAYGNRNNWWQTPPYSPGVTNPPYYDSTPGSGP